MMTKKFHYADVDGNHWPDADKGDELYYSIDFSCWLTTEADEVVTLTWTVPEGVTVTDEFFSGTQANIKLKTDQVGTFKIIAKLTSVDSAKEQTNAVPMMLRVN